MKYDPNQLRDMARHLLSIKDKELTYIEFVIAVSIKADCDPAEVEARIIKLADLESNNAKS